MPSILFEYRALKEFEDLPKPIKYRIFELVGRLGEWPNVSGAKPLKGDLAGHYRLRTGDYRLQFRIEKQSVVIERLGHRDGFYGE